MTRDVIGLKGERQTYAGVVSGSDIKMIVGISPRPDLKTLR